MRRIPPFRIQILVGFLTLQGVVILASLSLVGTMQRRLAEAEVRAQLETTSSMFRLFLNTRKDHLASSLRLLGSDFAFKRAVSMTKDPATVLSAANNFRGRIGSDAGSWSFPTRISSRPEKTAGRF